MALKLLAFASGIAGSLAERTPVDGAALLQKKIGTHKSGHLREGFEFPCVSDELIHVMIDKVAEHDAHMKSGSGSNIDGLIAADKAVTGASDGVYDALEKFFLLELQGLGMCADSFPASGVDDMCAANGFVNKLMQHHHKIKEDYGESPLEICQHRDDKEVSLWLKDLMAKVQEKPEDGKKPEDAEKPAPGRKPEDAEKPAPTGEEDCGALWDAANQAAKEATAAFKAFGELIVKHGVALGEAGDLSGIDGELKDELCDVGHGMAGVRGFINELEKE